MCKESRHYELKGWPTLRIPIDLLLEPVDDHAKKIRVKNSPEVANGECDHMPNPVF